MGKEELYKRLANQALRLTVVTVSDFRFEGLGRGTSAVYFYRLNNSGVNHHFLPSINFEAL